MNNLTTKQRIQSLLETYQDVIHSNVGACWSKEQRDKILALIKKEIAISKD